MTIVGQPPTYVTMRYPTKCFQLGHTCEADTYRPFKSFSIKCGAQRELSNYLTTSSTVSEKNFNLIAIAGVNDYIEPQNSKFVKRFCKFKDQQLKFIFHFQSPRSTFCLYSFVCMCVSMHSYT